MLILEDIKCYIVMVRIGGWIIYKVCGVWRGSLLEWWLCDILGYFIFMVWGIGVRVVILIRWEENSWFEWRLDVRILCRMLNVEVNNFFFLLYRN